MPGTGVGLYCAVVERFDLLVSTCTTGVRKTQAACNQRAEALLKGLGELNLGSEEACLADRERQARRPFAFVSAIEQTKNPIAGMKPVEPARVPYAHVEVRRPFL